MFYTVSKKTGTTEIIILRTRSLAVAYQTAERMSGQGWICVIRRYSD